MKKSICIETVFNEYSFEERFKKVKEAGFDYVEFWTWEDKNINKIKENIKKYNLKIASFSGDKNFSIIDEKNKENYILYILESIKIAEFLECKTLVIHSNALNQDGEVLNSYSYIDNYVKFINIYNTLMDLKPVVESNNILLVIEALNTKHDHKGNFLKYTKDSANLVRLVNSNNIKLLYDIYHMQIMEDKIIENLYLYKNDIGYIHIADVPGRNEPGTGKINFYEVVKTLNEINYEKIVGFELFPKINSEKAIRAINTFFN